MAEIKRARDALEAAQKTYHKGIEAESWYPRCDKHPLGNAKKVRPLNGGRGGTD